MGELLASSFKTQNSKLLLFGCFLQVWAFFWNDRAFHRAHLQADTAVDAGGKIDPVPIHSFQVFVRAWMDTGNRAGIDTICYAFTSFSHD